MPSRYHARFGQRKAGRSGGVVPPGTGGEAPPKSLPGERTASWPSAGPAGPMPFNKKSRWPVVKTAASKQGLC